MVIFVWFYSSFDSFRSTFTEVSSKIPRFLPCSLLVWMFTLTLFAYCARWVWPPWVTAAQRTPKSNLKTYTVCFHLGLAEARSEWSRFFFFFQLTCILWDIFMALFPSLTFRDTMFSLFCLFFSLPCEWVTSCQAHCQLQEQQKDDSLNSQFVPAFLKMTHAAEKGRDIPMQHEFDAKSLNLPSDPLPGVNQATFLFNSKLFFPFSPSFPLFLLLLSVSAPATPPER